KNIFALAGDMAGVANNEQVGILAFEFNRNFPHGVVAVFAFAPRRESAMHHHYFADAAVVNAFNGTNPQIQIGIYRVLYYYGNIHTFHGIGNFLNRERIYGGASTNP